MTAGSRTRRSACLLVAILLVLGLTGTAGVAAGAGDGRPIAVSVAGGPAPHAVLALHAQPRLGVHRPGGDAAALLSALVIALLLGRRRRTRAARGLPAATARPARGSRAPPARTTPS
jgi:hypothetical protein